MTDDFQDGWEEGVTHGLDLRTSEIITLQNRVRQLEAENLRLYKMAYFTIPIPKFLRRNK